MADVLNPVDIEQAIREASQRIHKGVTVVTNAEDAFREADRDYDAAFAQAFLDHDGPQTEKRYAAELKTASERKARDIAELAFKRAERTARALERELSALQSIGASVRTMYGSQS